MIQISIPDLQKVIKWLFIAFWVLFLINALIIGVSYFTGHGSIYGIFDLFDFDLEGNIPSYFSSFCLLLSAFLLYMIFRIHKQHKVTDAGYWLALAIGFLYLSIDDFTQIHEKVTVPIRNLYHADGLFYFSWVILGLIICLLVILFFAKFYWRLPSKYRVLFGASALIFVGGAIGVEMISGMVAPIDGSFKLNYVLLVTLEQSMQWLAEILFLYSLSNYLGLDIQTESRRIQAAKSIPALGKIPQVIHGLMNARIKFK